MKHHFFFFLSLCSSFVNCVLVAHSYDFLQVENLISTYDPNGYMVVYAVDEDESAEQADRILAYLKSAGVIQQHAVILVANKADLVRSRVVSATGELSTAGPECISSHVSRLGSSSHRGTFVQTHKALFETP